MITLSCGHEVDSFSRAFDVMVKENNREGGKAIAYMVVCGPCEDGYRQDGQLFDNPEQAYDWLKHDRW